MSDRVTTDATSSCVRSYLGGVWWTLPPALAFGLLLVRLFTWQPGMPLLDRELCLALLVAFLYLFLRLFCVPGEKRAAVLMRVLGLVNIAYGVWELFAGDSFFTARDATALILATRIGCVLAIAALLTIVYDARRNGGALNRTRFVFTLTAALSLLFNGFLLLVQ